jgi:AcrR family transcriptional regulator
MHRIDPRKVRTRQMLREALIALILEKGYDSINIQEITEKAGLRRATFYLHYRDKEELLLTTLRDTFDELERAMEGTDHGFITLEKEYVTQLTIFKHAQENANLYRAILSGQGSGVILRYVRDYLIADVRDGFNARMQPYQLSIPVEVLANYIAGVTLNMATWWLDNGMPHSAEAMAEMSSRLIMNGLQHVFDSAVTQTNSTLPSEPEHSNSES